MRPTPWVYLVVLGAGLGACSGAHERPRERSLAAAAPVRKVEGVDVPKLLTLSIDEMAQQIGPRLPLPTEYVDPVMLPLTHRGQELDSMAFFRRRGLAIVASFDSETRRVNDLMLLGNNENSLLSRAQLQLGAEQYLVLPVFEQQHPTQLMGLRVLAITVN